MQFHGKSDEYPALAQVQRPLLPPAKAIRPYLDRIDAARWYSNRGPLLWELERRLYTHFGVDDHVVVLLASGSGALEAAILAHAGAAQPQRPLALMPSYTFAATAASAVRCGYEPYFLDVDPQDWMLDPKALAAHPMLERAGLVVPVAAYGRRPDMAAWEAFQATTGCSVVVDAAAAFEKFEQDPELISDTVPAVLSLHATKTFSTAEGGAVLWRDADGQRRVGRVSNFGLSDARSCLSDGFNGKLSEYHAAVGLAQLDLWQARQADLTALTDLYRDVASAGPLPGVLRLRPEVSGAYVVLDCFGPDAAVRVTDALGGQGIAWRRWYGKGLHLEPTHARRGHDPMPVTERLSQCHIGLPAAVDLSARDVARVSETLLGVN